MSGLKRRIRRRWLRFRAGDWLLDPVDRVRGVLIGNMGRSNAYVPGGNRVDKISRFMPGDEPVLLIQGFVHTRGVLEVLEGRLRRDGFPVFSINLAGFLRTYNTRPIESLAQLISEKIERLQTRHSFSRMSIIAHSMGGLVSRYYVQALEGHLRVKTLITLGTPHHGTPTAYVASVPPLSLVTVCGRQMLPGSSFIRDLSARSVPPGVKLVSIFSRADLVCPYRYSVVEPRQGERVRNLCVDGIGHTSLLHSDRVYRLIRKELEPEPGQSAEAR
jgi:hypothetical protein